MDKKILINELKEVEAWLTGLLLKCQKTRTLLEADDVSTSSNVNSISNVAIEAKTRLRAKILKHS